MEQNEKYDTFVGKILDKRYKILEGVGAGGMSVVLKAEDTVMNRIVAIKMLNDECNRDESAVRRFVNESKAVAMLSHPNIVNIYDVAFGSDMKYIVMEYIDGITLNDYMQKKGKIPWRDAVHFADQILLALEHAHEKGIVHRDVKPQNIMLLRNGTVKVADFGIATLPNIENAPSQDKAIGTVYYMSPEQACGQPTDIATDIYSLGVMLYEMTTGELPFDGKTTLDIATKQVNELPKEPRSIEITIPRGLEQIILKAMEKKPSDRYANAHTMRRALQILKNNPSIVFAEKNGSHASSDAGVDNTVHESKARYGDTITAGDKIPVRNTPVNANEKPVDGKNTSDKQKSVAKPTEGKKRVISKSKGKSSMFPIILGVALAFLTVLIVGGAVLATSIFENSNGVGTVYEIPNYIGMEYSDLLKEQIIADGLLLKDVKYQYDTNSEKDYVVDQNPAPESTRKTRDLTLTVSLGTQTVVMSDLAMCMYTKAEVYLSNMGLKPVVKRISDVSIMENYIIRTEPAAGETVKIGDTVTLYVSTGSDIEFVVMPELVGKTEEEAKRLLTENGITKVEVVTEKSARPDGEVLKQDVAAGTDVPKETAEITLTVSEYDSALDPNVPPTDLPVSSEVSMSDETSSNSPLDFEPSDGETDKDE